MSADSNDIALIGKLFEREDQWRQRVDDALALAARIDKLEGALDPATFGGFANSVTGLLEQQGQQLTAILDLLRANPQQPVIDQQVAILTANNDQLANAADKP